MNKILLSVALQIAGTIPVFVLTPAAGVTEAGMDGDSNVLRTDKKITL